MKKALKQQILLYLVFVFGTEVFLYVIADFAYMLGIMSKINSQISFYTTAVFAPFLWGWIFFIVPYVIVRKCEKCGSKNIRPTFPREKKWVGVICDECNYVFKSNIHNTRMIISAVIPFLFFGPSFSLGNVLAGKELSESIIVFSILFSSVMPSVLTEIIYATKLNNSAFVKEHKVLGFILFLISFFVLPFLMLIGYGVILKFLFTGTI